MAIPEVDKSLTKALREIPEKGKSENGRINTGDLWWAWVDLNHQPRPYQGLLWCYMHSNYRVWVEHSARNRMLANFAGELGDALPSRCAIYNGLGNRCSPENRGKLKDAIFRREKIDYGEEFGDSAHRWNS
jgi:hypothetical protein